MGLENFKRWHWMIIGLLFGAMFGGTRVLFRDADPGAGRTFDRRQFEEYLPQGMLVRNLELQPKLDGQEWLLGQYFKFNNGGHIPPRQPQQQQRRPMRLWGRRAATQPAPVVAVPTSQPDATQGTWVDLAFLAAEENSTQDRYKTLPDGREYIAQLKTRFPDQASMLEYRFAWWRTPKAIMTIYTAGGFVLIGVIWPTMVSLLSGAGFAGRKEEADGYDLSRFKGGAEPAKSTAAGVTDADQQQLADLNAQLEASVADMAQGDTAPDIDHDAEEAAVVKKLQSVPANEQVPLAAAKDEKKAYQGEFYPVVRPGGKK